MQKTIVVTGASSGIGRAFALHLASLGHTVIAVARRGDMLEEIQKVYPDNIKIEVGDITRANDRIKIKQAIDPSARGIFLIHNAGVAFPDLISHLTEEQWMQHLSTNLSAPVFLTQLLLPHLKDGGRVLNISSGLAYNPCNGMAAYGISKAGLFMFKKYANHEFQKQKIAFGSAKPGVDDTPMQANLRSFDEEIFPEVNTFQGFFERNELLKPEIVAKFITWLLFEVEDEKFVDGDWDIYDKSHHKYWAAQGEVTPRQQTTAELAKEPVESTIRSKL